MNWLLNSRFWIYYKRKNNSVSRLKPRMLSGSERWTGCSSQLVTAYHLTKWYSIILNNDDFEFNRIVFWSLNCINDGKSNETHMNAFYVFIIEHFQSMRAFNYEYEMSLTFEGTQNNANARWWVIKHKVICILFPIERWQFCAIFEIELDSFTKRQARLNWWWGRNNEEKKNKIWYIRKNFSEYFQLQLKVFWFAIYLIDNNCKQKNSNGESSSFSNNLTRLRDHLQFGYRLKCYAHLIDWVSLAGHWHLWNMMMIFKLLLLSFIGNAMRFEWRQQYSTENNIDRKCINRTDLFVMLFHCVFYSSSVFIWSYCELLIANCHRKCFKYDRKPFQYGGITFCTRFDSIVDWLAFTVYNAVQCSFYMFLLSLVPVKNENPVLQRRNVRFDGHFKCLQPGCIPNGIQNFWFEWFHFFQQRNELCRVPSILMIN